MVAQTTRFELGTILMTPGVEDLVKRGLVNPFDLLYRHRAGDWGDLDDDDRAANDQALQSGDRLMSAYETPGGRVWIVTEGVDDEGQRAASTLLRPDEY